MFNAIYSEDESTSSSIRSFINDGDITTASWSSSSSEIRVPPKPVKRRRIIRVTDSEEDKEEEVVMFFFSISYIENFVNDRALIYFTPFVIFFFFQNATVNAGNIESLSTPPNSIKRRRRMSTTTEEEEEEAVSYFHFFELNRYLWHSYTYIYLFFFRILL